MKELENILNLETTLAQHDLLDRDPRLKQNILDALKTAYNKGLKDSVKSVELKRSYSHVSSPFRRESIYKYAVDQDSILKLLIP